MGKHRCREAKKIRTSLWRRLFGCGNGYCFWCRKDLFFTEATLDHDPALSEGGTKYDAVISCYDCNQERAKETDRRLNKQRKLIWSLNAVLKY